MPDPVDLGQAREEELRQDALAEHRRRMVPPGSGSDECQGCGDAIPEERRRAVPNACLCVACQTAKEKLQLLGKQ